MITNPGCFYNFEWFKKVQVNLASVNNTAKIFANLVELDDLHKFAWLLKAVTLIDLTTLAGDDTTSNVTRLCQKAAFPINSKILKDIDFKDEITTASVCVYPSRVKDAVDALSNITTINKINVASVAAGFPSGQMPLESRLSEIRYAINVGANEIDIVIDRSLVLGGQWKQLYDEIKLMKEACGPDIHMKTILATGELGTLTNVYKASMVAMMAGSDFIKTSTGKESLNATLPFGIVMCRAINDYYRRTGYKVGLKPAGGIKTSKDAISWLILIKEMLGLEWMNRDFFRFGASGLLDDIEKELIKIITVL